MAADPQQVRDIAKKLDASAQQMIRETRELDLLVESTNTEVSRLRTREEQMAGRVLEMQRNPTNYQREDIFGAYTEFAEAMEKRVTMEGQLTALQSKRKLMDRMNPLVQEAAATAKAIPPAPPPGEQQAPAIDETRLLQAVVDTQEEERRRLARQVHDGPAQALSNVVLQAEISERLFELDPQRSRVELASLRQHVNQT